MVICKYFQQGACRFGQYCRFEHVNNFGNNQASGKAYGETKNIVLGVAEEILAAERGGQWLLSCFAPAKEGPCIPGMDDVSPEEVRWEMYQAQKNGTVDQTKLQFQQLCQAMNEKREVLKNPTHETAAMLEKLQKESKNFGTKSNFSLATPQLGNNQSGSTVFGSKTFGNTTGPFSSSTFSSTPAGNSIFGRSNTSSTNVFGAKPAFGGSAVFGSQAVAPSVFGAAAKSTTSVFGNAGTMPTFGTAAQSGASVFSGTATSTQSMFGQSSNNLFATSQSAPLFSSSTTGQTSASPFGNTTQGTTTLFGGATTIQPVNSLFGNQSAAPVSSSIGSSSIFGQPKSSVAFGGAPVFGATQVFGSGASGSSFGAQPTFSTSPSIFGTSTTTSTFGSNIQTTNSFGTLATPASNAFTSPQTNSSPFGNVIPAATGTAATFGTSATNSGPFSRPAAPFGTPAASTASSTFGVAASNGGAGFGPPPAFASTPSTPFASTTITTSTSNPFAPASQQISTTFTSTPSGTAFGGMSTSAFGKLNFTATASVAVIDETVYSTENDLTDDAKNMYLAEQFTLGKIPLKPPTIELR